MKDVFETAAKKILLENDSNKNRRLDKSELKVLGDEIPSFMQYALENQQKTQEQPEIVQVAKKKEPLKKKYAIDEIYD
jgi:hypothetical protein